MTATLNPFESDQAALVPIGAAYSVTLGKMLDAGKTVDDSYTILPYIRAANIQDDGLRLGDVNEMPFSEAEAVRLDLRRGDLLVVEGGAVGTTAVLGQDMPGWSFQKTVNRVRSIGDWSTRYLGYVLRAYRDAGIIELVCNGSTIPHLTAEKLRALRIPSADPGEQHAIADYLDHETARIDTLIEEQQRLIEMLRERRQAVVDASFSALEQPGVQLRRYIKFLTSGSRGWGDYYTDQGQRFLRIGNLPRANLKIRGDIQFVELPVDVTEGSRTMLQKGDLLFSITAYLGSVAVVECDWVGAYVSQHVALCRLELDQVDPKFIGWFMLTTTGQDQLNEGAAGGTKIQLALDDIRGLRVPTAPIAQQRCIAAHLDRGTTKIDVLVAETERFIEYARERRAALITAAVTGQIDVRDMA